MITFDQSSCNGCGLCVKICHEHCMTLEENNIHIDRDVCSHCCQCVAVCPTRALEWDGKKPVPFDKNNLPSPEQIDELLMQRRTIRFFKKEKVDREDIEKIINLGNYAPTHSPVFRTIAVDDDLIFELIDGEVYRNNKKIYRYLFKPKIMRWMVKRFGGVYLSEFNKARPKLESSLEHGCAYPNRPPVLLFVVGDKRIPLMMESAQYVLYNMMLAAQARGLGCRNLVGNQMFLTKNKKVRRRLGLKKHERIFGFMGVGYPAVKFSNKVRGREMPVQWNAIP
ncbi:MAG: nitroreductase family protein [Candidatus Aminicenantes bacterium]|nr:nitroreductase family protein [Candidatus Aminicenantes bacterium]